MIAHMGQSISDTTKFSDILKLIFKEIQDVANTTTFKRQSA